MRNWLVHFVIGAAVLLCCLLATELTLRLLGWSYPIFVRADAEFGWSFRPNTSGWSTHEDTAYVSINRFGFRGGDWSEHPAPGALRIAVLGDSMTDSTNLAEADSLTRKVQTHLSTCPKFAGRQIEVLNFGVSGYTTSQQYLQLQHVAAFSPGIVLLAYSAASDVPENIRALSPLEARPFFVMLPSGDLLFDGSFRDSDEFHQRVKRQRLLNVVNSSYLLQAFKQVYLRNPIFPTPHKSQVFKMTGSEVLPPLQYPQRFGPPADKTWASAWTVTEGLLLRMRDWLHEHKVSFGLVIIPDPAQALPSREMRQAMTQKYGLVDLDYPASRIADFAARNRISHLNLLDGLRDFGDHNRQFAFGFYAERPGDGHLNAVGADVSARAIADWLCSSAEKGDRLN